MIIQKKRIRNIHKYLSHFKANEEILIGIPISSEIIEKVNRAGFPEIKEGLSLIPSPKLGPISRFNALGKDLPLKNLPKETLFRQQEWSWKDWGGNSHSRIVDIPYQRYQREWVPAHGTEILIVNRNNQYYIIVNKPLNKSDKNEQSILLNINLLLELFGEAHIYNPQLMPLSPIPIIRLDWEVLPQGEQPWEKLKIHVINILDTASKSKRIILKARLDAIKKYNPDFHAIGTNGYRGYIVFGFSNLGIYIFENAEYGNATYIFDQDWEKLTNLTKAEIIRGDYCKDRITHTTKWQEKIKALFLLQY